MAQSAINQHIAALAGIPQQPTQAAPHQLPAVKPGYRMVPALVGKEGQEVTAWVECPDWCVTDHVADRATFLEDLNHSGERRGMSFTPSRGQRVPVEVYLAQWPGSHEPAPTLAVDLDYEVENYGRTAALALADQLAAFTEDVRRLAVTLPEDSDPDMDEALRRVRGGRA
ncbi:DUF6907 domain-containing protein [Streptomyces griseoluteus]|uniref:DUF6907 domain-containing protein n=1 Tax=Streptomyces griseoluteus TaxID=29306 RepID=UPI00380F9DB2